MYETHAYAVRASGLREYGPDDRDSAHAESREKETVDSILLNCPHLDCMQSASQKGITAYVISASILKNTIQEYAWGSRTAISALTGAPVPSKTPQAELWMGAHIKAPSSVLHDGNWISITEWIESAPVETLGQSVAAKFDSKLPFLMKFLAAEQPLSIQVHPNLAQAKSGFDSENQFGIPWDSAQRNYRDENHKPEIICAVTPFWALNGFRCRDEITELLNHIGAHRVRKLWEECIESSEADATCLFFFRILELDSGSLASVIHDLIKAIATVPPEDDPIIQWIPRLNASYPNDVGLLCALILNVVRLSPGEAMYLPAGRLHAYLEGAAIELMASSDNVLRGGLTNKHVDIPALKAVVDLKPTPIEIMRPASISRTEEVYKTAVEEFRLSRILVSRKTHFRATGNLSVAIFLCIEGEAMFHDRSSGQELPIEKGQSFIVPGSSPDYEICGQATLFRADVDCR